MLHTRSLLDKIHQNLFCYNPLGTKVYIHLFVGNFVLKSLGNIIHLAMWAENVLTSVFFSLTSMLMKERELVTLFCNFLPRGLWLLLFCGFSSWQSRLVCSVWFRYFLSILTFVGQDPDQKFSIKQPYIILIYVYLSTEELIKFLKGYAKS